MTPLPTLEQQVGQIDRDQIKYSEIENLKQYYTLRQPEAIASFIEQNRSLLPILQAAPQEIAKYFPGKKLELEYYLDPEYSNDHPGELVLHIKVFSPEQSDTNDQVTDINWANPDENLKQMELLDDHWWLAASDQCQQKIFINLAAQ